MDRLGDDAAPPLPVVGVAAEAGLPLQSLGVEVGLLQEVADLLVPAVLIDAAARPGILDRTVALLDIHAVSDLQVHEASDRGDE